MRRDARFYVENDPSGLVRGTEAELDALALEEHGLQRLRHADTVARLERLGLDGIARRYAPLTPPAPELHDARWPSDEDYLATTAARGRPIGAKPRRTAPDGDPAPDLGRGVVVRRGGGRVTGVR